MRRLNEGLDKNFLVGDRRTPLSFWVWQSDYEDTDRVMISVVQRGVASSQDLVVYVDAKEFNKKGKVKGLKSLFDDGGWNDLQRCYEQLYKAYSTLTVYKSGGVKVK